MNTHGKCIPETSLPPRLRIERGNLIVALALLTVSEMSAQPTQDGGPQLVEPHSNCDASARIRIWNTYP